MKVFCPNCGSENEGLGGGRVVCRACTATFEVPVERPSQVVVQAPSPAQPPQAYPPQPYPPQAPAAPMLHGQTPYGQPSVPPMKAVARPTNVLAVVSLVTGLLCCPPVALITGFIGLQQVNQSEGRQGGKELAIIGIVLGCLGLCTSILYAIGMAGHH